MPKALNIAAKAPSADRIEVSLVEFGSNAPSPGNVTLEIRAASLKGNASTDSYSLAGFSQAMDRLQKECPPKP